MLVTKLNLAFSAFCPTPEEFGTYDEYLYAITNVAEMLAEGIYIENKLALKGLDFGLMEESF